MSCAHFLTLAACLMCAASCAPATRGDSSSPSTVHSDPTGTKAPVALTVERLTTADPVEDLRLSLLGGDERFIAIDGFSTEVPGTDRYFNAVKALGIEKVQGASDTLPLATQDAVQEYATVYNILLIRHLRDGARLRVMQDRGATMPSVEFVPGL